MTRNHNRLLWNWWFSLEKEEALCSSLLIKNFVVRIQPNDENEWKNTASWQIFKPLIFHFFRFWLSKSHALIDYLQSSSLWAACGCNELTNHLRYHITTKKKTREIFRLIYWDMNELISTKIDTKTTHILYFGYASWTNFPYERKVLNDSNKKEHVKRQLFVCSKFPTHKLIFGIWTTFKMFRLYKYMETVLASNSPNTS